MNKNKSLWKKSKVILQGNSLLSKNPENYSKDWPAYFHKAKGCFIWSIDKKYASFLIWVLVQISLIIQIQKLTIM